MIVTLQTERIRTIGQVAAFVEANEPAISERLLVPVLDGLLGLFPFVVVGFHADNGSEYVNHTVAALLGKLHVRDFTKSRPRRSTDNALVEGRNANVVRRFLGHDHIPQRFAPLVDAFAREHLSPYLNYHRPCLFATEREGANGRVKRVYRARDVRTPYDKLRSLPGAEQCLRPGVSFAMLDAEAHAVSDLPDGSFAMGKHRGAESRPWRRAERPRSMFAPRFGKREHCGARFGAGILWRSCG